MTPTTMRPRDDHRDGADPFGSDPPAAWPDAYELTAAGLVDAFAEPGCFSIGVEEELMLLDPVTLDVTARSDQVLARLGGDTRFRRELLAAQLEIVTPALRSSSEVASCLASARRRLVDTLDGDALIAAAGVHPYAS